MINTTYGEMDESLLLKTSGSGWVEYCLLGCPGGAHKTRHPDGECVFCSKHVHRSVTAQVKGVAAVGAAAKFR